jgi:glycosyltransferase involved in cell wall biosynthesis
MKILFCKNNFVGPISGADEIAVTYASELKGAGHNTSILLVHAPSKRDPLALRLREAGIPLNTLASPAFSASLETARKLAIRAMHTFSPASGLIRSNSRKIVSDLLQRYHNACCKYLELHRPDLVHVLTPGPGAEMLIRAAHDTNIPIIYQEVGIPFHPPGFEEVYERFVSVLPLCTKVAVLSPCLAEELTRVLPNVGAAHVLPLISLDHNGISPTNSTSDVVTFGFAARLEHLKGPMRLLDGFRIAHETTSQISLKLAGEGSQRNDFVMTTRRFGLENKCQLVGVYATLEERSRFMTGIDVFVLPSLTEGTPNVIIEAMAHAKPIIATAVGGVPDLVSEEVGILVPSDDSRALGAAMARLAGDVGLRRRMGIAARKKYEQLFTPQAVLPLLVDFYEQAMERHAANNRGVVKSNNRERPLAKSNHPWFVTNARTDAAKL